MTYLTSIRGIAAFLVVLYHAKLYLHQHDITSQFDWLYNKGYLAVDFFFILSGFIIAYTYQKLFEQRIDIEQYRVFITKRFARIFPLHAFVMLCFCLIPLAFFLTGKPIESKYNVYTFLVKFTLTDAWLVGSNIWNSWNTASWTISGEFFAYLSFPFLSYVYCRLKPSPYLILCCSFW